MVKGVSKTVIVVNDTGSKFFEKIVFYVTPEYGTLSAKQLKKAASDFSFRYEEQAPAKSLRTRVKRKRLRKLLIGGAIFLIVLAGILIRIF